MNKWINNAKLFFALSFILTTLNCGFLPKSECELTEADGRNILGINVTAIDKNSSAFGDSEKAKNDKNLRACGYVAEKPGEGGNLYWMQTHSADIQEAKRLYGIVTDPLTDTKNYSAENLTGIGDEAKLSRFENGDSKKLEIAVRKGKNVLLITVSKPSASEIPVEQVKSLAERLAAKTTDY